MRISAIILHLDNEADCADWTGGAAKNKVAVMQVFAMWPLAPQDDIAIWLGLVPSRVNPADLPPRDEGLAFETGSKRELATVEELFLTCDLSWLLQHAD